MRRIDWPAMLRAGLGGLHLPPEVFWAMTPAELLLMLGLEGGATSALGRARLAELSAAFPDRAEGNIKEKLGS